MTPIVTERLVIRNWEERDRELFFRINSNDRVMEFFPLRRSREQADRMLDQLRSDIEAKGYGFTALALKESGECIGFAGLHADDVVPSLPSGTVEIGWRLAPEFWGKGYVTEAATALLELGFETMELDLIVSFAVWNNERSIAVMKRIGMKAEPYRDFDHPRVPDSHPHLKPHVFYRITREEWLKGHGAA